MIRSNRCALCGRIMKNKRDIYMRKWEYHYCSVECYKMDKELDLIEEDTEDMKKLDLREDCHEYYDINCDDDIYDEPFSDMDEELV